MTFSFRCGFDCLVIIINYDINKVTKIAYPFTQSQLEQKPNQSTNHESFYDSVSTDLNERKKNSDTKTLGYFDIHLKTIP